MATIYVTEHCRFLSEPFKGRPKQLDSVRATVSTLEHDPMAVRKLYKPDEWRALLAQPEVVHRFRDEPYLPPHCQ